MSSSLAKEELRHRHHERHQLLRLDLPLLGAGGGQLRGDGLHGGALRRRHLRPGGGHRHDAGRGLRHDLSDSERGVEAV